MRMRIKNIFSASDHYQKNIFFVGKMELVSQDLVKSLLTMGKTYQEISTELTNVYPEIKRGLSELSVRRYVRQHNLKRLCEQDKEQAIQECSRGKNFS